MDLALAFEDAQPFRLTVEQYHDLMEQGVIEEGPRIELLEGVVVCMNSQGRAHTVTSFELAVRLRERLNELGSPLTAVTTPTIAIPPRNAPEPDIGVVNRPVTPGAEFFPVADARLLIEISLTSLRRDIKGKRELYARAGVPEYWVVDVNKAEVHRFADPRDGEYRAEPPVPLAGELRSLTIPELAIDGSGIL